MAATSNSDCKSTHAYLQAQARYSKHSFEDASLREKKSVREPERSTRTTTHTLCSRHVSCCTLDRSNLELALDESCLIDFALLVDGVGALKHPTEGIPGHFDPEVYCDFIKHDLIASSYILDQPAYFRRFTKYLVRQSASHYRPDLDPQLQDLTIEHLPASFTTFIIHQQNAVRNELVKCLTKIIDQFTTASYVKGKPNLVLQLMAAMKSKELWAILPVNSGSKSLGGQLASFSSLELPITGADRDRSY